MSIKTSEIFVENERQLGRYSVEILMPTGGGWQPAVMPLEALVSNFRLLLKPFRKKYSHASIPSSYLTKVYENKLSNYLCVSLHLKTGHEIHLGTVSRYLPNLLEDLRAMRTPPPKFQFDESVARADIERLISYFHVKES